MHIPRLKVWKLREPNVRQEFVWVVAESKNDVLETNNVENKWKAMKDYGSRTSMWVDKRTAET